MLSMAGGGEAFLNVGPSITPPRRFAPTLPLQGRVSSAAPCRRQAWAGAAAGAAPFAGGLTRNQTT